MTGRTAKSIEKALDMPIEHHRWAQLLAACDNEQDLAVRVAPFHGLLRDDLRGLPQVYVANSVYVTKTGERRSSGTYYTPRSLAEEMVEHALSPLVYEPGPAEGANPEDWKLKPARGLLELKVCDMAMGSGAFLVAATRYLADRLLEAWAAAGEKAITPEGEPASRQDEAIPEDPDDQLILARRLVADRCIYGVDKNPMAVDMAKLSMWLITLGKDRPFSFLDHALKCGDSLLGIHDLAQIEHLHMNPQRGEELHTTLDEHWHIWQAAVKEAIERRRELESFTVLTVREAELKERLFREAEEALDDLKIVGDVIVSAALSTARDGEEKLDSRLLELAREVAAALDPSRKEEDRRVRLENLRTDALYWLNEGKPAMQLDRQPFHWPLEFPEVLADRRGFHAIVGNPPFQGGQKITGALGTDYRDYLVERIALGRRGSADLVVYFLLRAAQLVSESGLIGSLATNTVSQGDTREVGLEWLIRRGMVIFRAVRSRPWPGVGTVSIAQIWLRRGSWEGEVVLEGNSVAAINPSLFAISNVQGPAHRLVGYANTCFQGTNVLGKGFFMTEEEAQRLIEQDRRNGEVLFPFLGGNDLNDRWDQSPGRWVINFQDWPLERAEQYPDCIAIVREQVKPVRDRNRDRRRRETWWQFTRPTVDLYKAIGYRERVLAITLVSNTVMPSFVRTGIVYSHKLGVYVLDQYSDLAVLSSSFHWWWTVHNTSTLGTGINYSPTDCFETFPQPELTDDTARVAKALDEQRRAMMLLRKEGLTKTYNRVHDPKETASDVVELRRLHIELDNAVAAAYGWSDLNLEHSFDDTPQGLRYTVGPVARVEILDRLLELNHERYEQEASGGLHAQKAGRKRKKDAANMTLDGIK